MRTERAEKPMPSASNPSTGSGRLWTGDLILRSARRARLEGWETDKVLVPPFEMHRCATLLKVR